MIDWPLVAKVAGGGYGITIFVLVVLSLATWILGLIIQKTTKTIPDNKVSPGKEIPGKDK